MKKGNTIIDELQFALTQARSLRKYFDDTGQDLNSGMCLDICDAIATVLEQTQWIVECPNCFGIPPGGPCELCDGLIDVVAIILEPAK